MACKLTYISSYCALSVQLWYCHHGEHINGQRIPVRVIEVYRSLSALWQVKSEEYMSLLKPLFHPSPFLIFHSTNTQRQNSTQTCRSITHFGVVLTLWILYTKMFAQFVFIRVGIAHLHNINRPIFIVL
jgi:hypothetical protein